ncbi:hypothetical protein B0O80DRAFT_522764 [Mortierella sp. GBAus27b]|nr:hypothetical protein B0O80DRAFT_522764 [Mortierella sp. GBAus27b]
MSFIEDQCPSPPQLEMIKLDVEEFSTISLLAKCSRRILNECEETATLTIVHNVQVTLRKDNRRRYPRYETRSLVLADAPSPFAPNPNPPPIDPFSGPPFADIRGLSTTFELLGFRAPRFPGGSPVEQRVHDLGDLGWKEHKPDLVVKKGAYSKIENDNGLFVLRKVGQFKLPYNGPGIIELAKSYNVMIRARIFDLFFGTYT